MQEFRTQFQSNTIYLFMEKVLHYCDYLEPKEFISKPIIID